MMSLRVVSLFAVAAASLIALPACPVAAQQHVSWDNYCSLGNNPLCASIELDLTPDGNGTSVGIRMRNLEGTLGATPWELYQISFLFELVNNPAPTAADLYPRATMSGTAGQIVTADPATCAMFPYDGCPGQLWGIMPWEWRGIGGAPPGMGILQSAIQDVHRTPIGIVGCDVPPQPGSPSTDLHWALGYFQTCGDGWVDVNFRIPETVTFTENSRLFVAGCEFDVKCVPVTTTPEPGTLILVASGLVGVLAWRRRRQMWARRLGFISSRARTN